LTRWLKNWQNEKTAEMRFFLYRKNDDLSNKSRKTNRSKFERMNYCFETKSVICKITKRIC